MITPGIPTPPVVPVAEQVAQANDSGRVPVVFIHYKRQQRNPGVTEFVEIPDRGHALTIDHGWSEVAQTALAFIRRFT
jgi:pimeloyl-ACP methyl ester carboxylesterase